MNCSALGICAHGKNCGLKRTLLAVSLPETLMPNTRTVHKNNHNGEGRVCAYVCSSDQLSHPKNISTIMQSEVFCTNFEICRKSKNPEMAAKIIHKSDIICFDVDSTVICEEGIDELAAFCGKDAEVAQLTKQAMGGSMTFQEALTTRLNIIKPSEQQICDFVKKCPSTLTNNVKRLMEQLKCQGKDVYLISGGFSCLIEPIAEELGIPFNHLFANKLMFQENGEYATFDTSQPTSKSGGKAEAIGIIRRQHPNALITMIGDGATDLEAVPPANHFIGFGGNVVREEVYKRAEYYIIDFEELM